MEQENDGNENAYRISNQLAAPLAGLDVATQADLKKKNIGYMSQNLYDDLTIKENITF
jgi:ABC-type multidrug transport system ATPase subunit